MLALYIIGGIFLFFIVVFSVHVHVMIDYGDTVTVKIGWLFLKIPVVDTSKPKSEKKPKKKKEKDKKEKGDDKEDKDKDKSKDKKKSDSKKGGNSLIKQLYLDQGYDGIEKMLRAVGSSLSGFFGELWKTIVIEELYITMKTVGSDAADTAIKHGKLCSWLYPVLGKLVSMSKIKKYDFDITPDFLAVKQEATLYADVRITPITITNAAVVLAFRLVFKVLFKVLFAKKKSDKSKTINSSEKAPDEKAAIEEGAQKGQTEEKSTDIIKEGASK